MIKTSVLGGSTPLAGELIRILLRHPEVDLINIYSPKYAGQWIGMRHKGLVGDTEMRFSDRLDLTDIDCLFVCDSHNDNVGEVLLHGIPENTKVIVLDDNNNGMLDLIKEINLVEGLSEVFRKPLVRDARAAKIFNPVETLLLISVYPLALHLMLTDDMDIQCDLPYWISRKKDKASIIENVDKILAQIQLSFPGIKSSEFKIGKDSRAVKTRISMSCGVSLEEIKKIYESIYDDHNFTFVIDWTPDKADVIGTQKCLIHFHKPSQDLLEIEAMADGVYRGGVGDAVHCMNLLFGLFEKIGLTFNSPLAFKEEYD